MKVLFSTAVGGDGGKVELVVQDQKLVLAVDYPVEKVLEPLKAAVFDKLKALIPGTIDDMILDSVWSEAVKLLSE